MRLGYSFWGFLGDHKLDDLGRPISAPDGNATYSWSIIHEVQRRGGTVVSLQEDRDWHAYKKLRRQNFEAFSTQKRYDAYMNCMQAPETFPELDVLLLEWRWPIDGRNCDFTKDLHPDTGMPIFAHDPFKHQPDFRRQCDLLRHYAETKTKIIVWDLDHKLTAANERDWRIDAIFETSSKPRELTRPRTRVEPPICTEDLLQLSPEPQDPNRKLVYVGSRYERDDVIDEFIGPVADRFPGQVEFWGKWDGDCRERWPKIRFMDRITVRDFRRVYGSAAACPLLAKRSYLESGFITPRPWEALMFGTFPIGLSPAPEIERYCLWTAKDGQEMGDRALELSEISVAQKHEYREMLAERLKFMDVKNFVDKIESVR